MILAHVVSMATLRGVPPIEAAAVLSTIAGFSAVSRFVFSLATERFGGRTCLTFAMFGQSASILILLFANEPWMFYAFAVIFGICYGGEMVGAYGAIANGGHFVEPIVVDRIEDRTGRVLEQFQPIREEGEAMAPSGMNAHVPPALLPA